METVKNKYNLNHNFGEYTNSVNSFLNKLQNGSINFFGYLVSKGKILKNRSTYTNPEYISELEKTKKFVAYVEEYLYYYYSKDRNNFTNVFNAVSNLEGISVLDDDMRGIYGITNPTHTIQINPNLSRSENLTSEQRTMLYISHELGHMVNSQWMKKVTAFLRNNTNLDNRQRQLFYDGFSLLDEATTQDRAEDIVYAYAHKSRPRMLRYRDSRGMYNGMTYTSNFDYYGELHEPAILFARTLRGIGKIKDNNVAMATLSKRALNPRFVDNVIYEYNRDGQLTNLYNEFQYLGFLKNASYARFGYADRSYIEHSGQIFDRLKEITSRLKDTREPFVR